MAFILHDEGEQYVLQVAFSDEQTSPANFYLGLCNDTLTETDALADILNEPSGAGYARQAIPSSNVGFTVALDSGDYQATATQETFTASGGAIGPVNTWFLATSSDNSGKLIASGPVTSTTLVDGDSLKVTITLKVA